MEDLSSTQYVHETLFDRLLLLDYLLKLICVVFVSEIFEVLSVNLIGLLRPFHRLISSIQTLQRLT